MYMHIHIHIHIHIHVRVYIYIYIYTHTVCSSVGPSALPSRFAYPYAPLHSPYLTPRSSAFPLDDAGVCKPAHLRARMRLCMCACVCLCACLRKPVYTSVCPCVLAYACVRPCMPVYACVRLCCALLLRTAPRASARLRCTHPSVPSLLPPDFQPSAVQRSL